MGRIAVLPSELTDKIAAGEVIERPASIVKELLENAMDAGATEVRIELAKGGREFIRITDNGEGMAAEDLPLAFARFATSKIKQFADMERVQSLGFRGEALPSIAAVCRVEMFSRRREEPAGARIVVEGGQVQEVSAAGCPPGTTVAVTRIFDTVPVRKKFLRADTTEQGACLEAITRLAISHPSVRLSVSAAGRQLLAVPATTDLGERLALILGDLLEKRIPLRAEASGLRVLAFASPPEVSHSTSRHVYCYVNRRFVKDRLLHQAVMAAYRHLIGTRRYPAAVVFLELPPEEVDVNVHPAKLEVRFRRPRDVYHTVARLLVEHLAHAATVIPATPLPFAAGAGPVLPGSASPPPRKRYTLWGEGEKLGMVAAEVPRTWPSSSQAVVPAATRADVGAAAVSVPAQAEPATPMEGDSLADLPYRGQIARTYLVFDAPEGLVLVDQHAAHERVLFEKLRSSEAAGGAARTGQSLLVPEVLSLPPPDLAVLQESLFELAAAGFVVEPFGGDAVVIKSVPALLAHVEPKALLRELILEFASTELARRRETIFAFLACRAAVKAGQELDAEEVRALCRSLDVTPFRTTCPHGRPLRVCLSATELAKLFKRR